MKIVLQRVKQAQITCQGDKIASIGTGVLLLIGFHQQDTLELTKEACWTKIVNKIPELRIFPDENGKSNKSLIDYQGDILVVSQFTLYADCRKGRRPSFTKAAEPQIANNLYESFIQGLKAVYNGKIESGIFGAEMEVSLTNWGPVTIILESNDFA